MRLALGIALLLSCGEDPPVSPPTEQALADGAPMPAPVARVETTDAWLDLIAQRPSAVALDHGAVVVDLDREAARKHLALGYRDVWALEQTVGDRTSAVIAGRTAALDVPVDAELAPGLNEDAPEHPALALAITVRSLVPKQSMTVLWNEQPLAHLRIDETWSRRTLSVPADKIRPGENRIRLHFRRTAPWQQREAAAAVERIEVGTHERITERPEGDGARYRIRPLGGGKTSLFVPPGGGLAYYFVAPSRGKLVVALRGRGAVRVVASTADDHEQGRAPTVLLDEPLRETGRRAELDLTAWGDAPVRLAIEARGSEEESGLTLTAAKIVARRTVPVDRRSRSPRDILVLSIEGARADAFAVGRRPPLTALDALIAESLVFERAYAPSPAAVPTHAAWLSSVAPPVHLTVRGTFVADRQSLIPEGLARAGFFRVLASANEYLNAERGLVQGFDHVEILGGAVEDDNARAVLATAAKILAGRRERWFLLADVDDTQAPYDPPREMLRDAAPPAGAPLPHLTHIWVGRVRMGKTEPSRKEVAYVRRLYRGELQVVDEALGELVEALRREGRYDDAIIVVIGAHGEEFFEHGGAGHGRTLYEESLRVPLILRAPELLAPGRVTAGVDLLDLGPTLFDLIGVQPPDSWQGESLVPVIDDPQPPPRLITAYLGDGSRAAIVDDQKLVLGPGRGERFYDLRKDAQESENVLASGGVGLRVVRAALAWQLAHEAGWRRTRWGTGANLKPAFALDLGM